MFFELGIGWYFIGIVIFYCIKFLFLVFDIEFYYGLFMIYFLCYLISSMIELIVLNYVEDMF